MGFLTCKAYVTCLGSWGKKVPQKGPTVSSTIQIDVALKLLLIPSTPTTLQPLVPRLSTEQAGALVEMHVWLKANT